MIEWLTAQGATSVYIGLFLLLMSGAFGFPPEDLTLILGGIAASRTEANIFVIFGICYTGTVLGDLLIYLMGRFFGKALMRSKWVAARLYPERIEKIRQGLERRSLIMIFVARHLFYFRTATFLVCGLVRLNIVRFLVTDAIAALISVPFMLSLGFWAAEHYEKIWSTIQNANEWLAIVLIFAGLISLRVFYSSKKNSAS